MSESRTIDPLTLSVIEGRLDSLNEELGERMVRQCFAFPTAHIRDLATVLFDKQERMVSIGNFIPAHSAGANVCLRAMLDWIGRDNLRPDDFIIANDPFIVRCGHVPDWSFVRPIFWDREPVFYHYAKTHQYDGGGAMPGCYFPRSFDCHAEGLMIPPLKLIEEGKIDEKLYSLILRNVRGAPMVRADNMLVYASMKKAEERILDMLRSHGKETVLAACDEIVRRTEEAVKKSISTWPAGTYRAERAADWDGTTDRPVWVRLALTVKPDEGRLIFDFTDSDSQVNFINVPFGQVLASVVPVLAWTLPSGTRRNQGLLNCMDVVTGEGTALDPVYPATTGAQAAVLGIQVIECSLLALAQVAPQDCLALWGRPLNPAFYGIRRDRTDPRTGRPAMYRIGPMHSQASNGAMHGYDGTDGLGTATGGGAVLRAPVEVEEWDAPYHWLHFEFLTDSAGAGQWRGGLGTHVRYLNTSDPKLWRPLDNMIQTGNSDGEKFGSLGILGGFGGPAHKLWIERNGERVQLRTCDVQYLQAEDQIVTMSGGGGGAGDPLARDIETVRLDVLNEYVSVEAARELYGVVIDPGTLEVDCQATAAIRTTTRAEQSMASEQPQSTG